MIIDLSADEEAALERLSELFEDDIAMRAEVIQWYAMGKSTDQIVRASGIEPDLALFWKAKFLEYGVEALFSQSMGTLTKRRG
ncbi:MAG: helix-turn-helix domain-containing protein [Deltaproteobacteria bacterium]